MTERYALLSGESKLLFGMILTNAEHTKAIHEAADLIYVIGEENIAGLKRQLELDLQTSERSMEDHGKQREYKI